MKRKCQCLAEKGEMMGASLFRTLHVSLHHLGSCCHLDLFCPQCTSESPQQTYPAAKNLKKFLWKKFQLLDYSKPRLTSHLQSLTNVFNQSPTQSPSRKMPFRHNRLCGGKWISQQSCLCHSSFLFSIDLPFFTERRRKKPTQQETVQNQFYFSFLDSIKEKSKGMKDCFTLGMLEKDLSHSDITLY